MYLGVLGGGVGDYRTINLLSIAEITVITAFCPILTTYGKCVEVRCKYKQNMSSDPWRRRQNWEESSRVWQLWKKRRRLAGNCWALSTQMKAEKWERIKITTIFNSVGIFKLLGSPGIDSASLCNLAGRYNNPIPIWFLAPIDCSKLTVHVWNQPKFKQCY